MNEDANREITLRETIASLIEQTRFERMGSFDQPWADVVTQEVLDAAQNGSSPPIDRILEKRLQSIGQLTDAEKRKAFLKWLEGVWLEATQQPTRAAADYCEAGRSYSGQENYEGAETLLTRANHLDPGHVPTYWDLAEACLMRTYRAVVDDVEGLLSKGIATWQNGAARTLPDSSTSWAYVSRAFMSERLAQLHPEGCEELWWEAAVYLERAILLNDQDALRWAALGRYHRCLDNQFSAVQVTADALERDPGNSSALEERVAILANVGEFDLAEQAIAELQRQPSWNENSWAQGVRAYLLAHKRKYGEAVQAISEVIQREGETIWNLDLQALCLRMVGDRAGAAQVDRKIWTIYEASDNPADDDKSTSGSAAYRLGKLNDAVAIFETLMDNRLQAANAYRSAGLCYLATGDARGEEYLLQGIERATSQIELDDFAILELSECENAPGSWVHRNTGTAILERVRAKVESRRAELEKPLAADKNATAKAALGELERLVASFGRGQNERWAWIGAQAGLARLHSQAERWREAATIYQDVLQADGRFPEAHLGIEKAIENLRAEAVRHSNDKKFAAAAGCLRDALAFESKLSSTGLPSLELHHELGEALWKAGQNREALNQFDQALALATDAGERQACADLRAAIGVVQHELEDGKAPDSLVASFKLYAESGVQDAGEAFANACRPLMRSASHFWKIDSLLKALGEEAAMEGTSRLVIAKARDSLLRYLDELFGLAPADLGDASLESFPIVTPIVLEVGARLVPKVDSKSDGGKFLSDIDAMRKRLQGRMGASLPGVRVRGNVSIAENSYVIMLDEVPIARGNVQIDMGFCPASAQTLRAAGITLEDFVEAEDPATGKPGCWVSAGLREAIESTRIAEWRNDTGFMLTHLEDVFHQNLSWCLGLQEAVELLMNESKRATGAPSVETILAEVPSRLRCARVLRALVREGVPVTELKSILETIQDRGLSNIHETVRAVRLKLRGQLPGNDTARQEIEVPEEWEGLQTQQEGTAVFTASPFVALQLLSQVRKWMESRDRNAVLITRSAALRPFLRRLVESEFPYVAVLSQDEILRPDALPSA